MSSDTHRAYIKAKMHCSWSLWAFRCIIVNYKNYKFLLLNWHKYTTCDSWLHLLAGFVFMSKRIFWCLATVSGTHSCKYHIIDINVMSILRHSVASPAITPWGSELGWTLTFAPAQASGGQTEGPQGPRGQHSILSSRWRWRSESRVHGSCFSRLGVLSHPEIYQSRSLVKLKAKKWGSFSSVGGIARLGRGDTGGRGTLEQQTLQLQLLTYMHPVHQEQKASPSTESWCLQGGGQHPALHEDCFTWVTWHSLTPVTLSHVHPLCLSLYFSEIVISQSYSWIHFETPVMIKTN